MLNQSDYAPKALALAFASRTEAYIAMKDGGDSPLESNRKLAAQPLIQSFATCARRQSFDAAPQLSKSYDAQEDVILANLVQPLDDSGVGARFGPFRDDVCVQ